MAFKHLFADLDFRADPTTQVAAIDTFFQNNSIESWYIDSNQEVILGFYDDTSPATNPTRFLLFDTGVGGIKSNITSLNGNTGIANFVAANEIIKVVIITNRYLAIQYKARP